MSKQTKLLVGILVITVLLLAASGLLTLPNTAKREALRSAPTQTAKPPTSSQPGLPIALDHSAVSLLLLSYSLNGDVVSVTPTADGATLVIASQNTSLPPLPLTKVTQVIRILPGVDGKQEKATLADIKTGTSVNVAAVYNTNTKEWVVHRVNLLPGTTTQTSTPEASQ